MSELVVDITPEEAVEAILEADFVTDEGRHVTHAIRGVFGADWDTEEAVRMIRTEATQVVWLEHSLWGRCLAIVTPNGKVTVFDNVHPLPKSEKEAREA
jgi:hypothetical protein